MKSTFTLSFIISLFVTIQCYAQEGTDEVKYLYPSNPSISDKDGTPTHYDNLSFFPTRFFYEKGNSWIEQYSNTRDINGQYLNNLFYRIDAKILYNYYLGYDIYRFTWIRAFHTPVVFVLTKTDKDCSLTYYLFNLDTDNVTLENNTIAIESKKYNKFLEKIEKTNFGKLEPTNNILGVDGSEWILEGHTKNNYKFLSRWCGGELKQCGTYLIELSGLNEEIY